MEVVKKKRRSHRRRKNLSLKRETELPRGPFQRQRAVIGARPGNKFTSKETETRVSSNVSKNESVGKFGETLTHFLTRNPNESHSKKARGS